MTDVLPVLLGVLLVVGAAAFALIPLLHGRAEPIATPAGSSASDERFRLYRQVVDLDFDLQTGKLSAEDHRALSAELLARATALLQSEATVGDVEEELEREIAAARRLLVREPAATARETAR